MNEEIKKAAEEEMNCILDLLEEWCLKYDQDYANAVVLVKHNQITSWGCIGPRLQNKRAPINEAATSGRIVKRSFLL